MDQSSSQRLFRRLTPANWLEHDGATDYLVRFKKDGSAEKLTGDDWASLVLKHELSPNVPEEIRNLFEVAQGVLCYGWYFYPLYTLGSEQFYRVLEAAVKHKSAEFGVPQRIKKFSERLNWLKNQGVFTDARFGRWNAARELRNMSSHADRQSLYDPTMAVGGVGLAAELINELFAEGQGNVETEE